MQTSPRPSPSSSPDPLATTMVTIHPLMSSKISAEEKSIHDQFVQLGTTAKEAVRKCAFMLPEIVRRSIWKKKGYASIYEYARVFAGMSGHAVDEALRVLKHIAQKSELMEIAREKGLHAVRPVATIATVETASFWAEKAKGMSVHALETYIREMRHQHQNIDVKNEAKILHVEEIKATKIIQIEVPVELAGQLEKLRDGRSWETLMRELLAYREQVLAQDQQIIQETHTAVTHAPSRYIPAEILKFILRRSRGLCEFGTCQKTYNILHHTKRFVLEKTHNPEHIIALCTAHERLAHLGLIENEDEEPKYWRVRQYADPGDNQTPGGKKTRAKYSIDTLVQKYRRPGVPLI